MARVCSSASVDLQNASQIGDVISRKQAMLVVHMPADFERQIESGRGAVVQVITDGRNSNTGNVAAGYVGAVVERFNTSWNEQHGGVRPPLTIESRAWYNPNLETRWNMIPSLIARAQHAAGIDAHAHCPLRASVNRARSTNCS